VPNILIMTSDMAETETQLPSATTVITKSKTLTEPNVVVPVTCVNLQDTDATIMDLVVITNTVKPRSRSFWKRPKNSSGDCFSALSSEQLLLFHCRCSYIVIIYRIGTICHCRFLIVLTLC